MTAISNMKDATFSCQYRHWNLSFDFNNTYAVCIYLKGKKHYDFIVWWLDKNNEEKIDYGEIREQLEKDPLFQETIERIIQWEEKMAKQLTINEVEVIETFNYLGEKFYAVGCYLTTPTQQATGVLYSELLLIVHEVSSLKGMKLRFGKNNTLYYSVHSLRPELGTDEEY